MLKTLLIGAAVAAIMPLSAQAATEKYRAVLGELNNSGVSGRVDFTVDTVAQTLRVIADISGLEPRRLHVNHIHGRFNDDGTPRNSVAPDLSDDADGNGFIDVFEGAPKYGDVLLSLEPNPMPSSNHNAPFAGASGNLFYDLTYSIDPTAENDPFFSTVSGADYEASDLFPLHLREYVIHGLTVPGGVFDDMPDGGYRTSLPVAAAQISAVPIPAAGLLLLSALGGLGYARRRRS